MAETNVQALTRETATARLHAAVAQRPSRSPVPSPSDWRDKVFYFLLPDRSSNGRETDDRQLTVDLSPPSGVARIRRLRGLNWRRDLWSESGRNR